MSQMNGRDTSPIPMATGLANGLNRHVEFFRNCDQQSFKKSGVRLRRIQNWRDSFAVYSHAFFRQF